MKRIIKPLLIIVAVAAISTACICNACIVKAEEVTLGVHDPIEIHGNSEFTLKNGVTSGSGTQADPYIIPIATPTPSPTPTPTPKTVTFDPPKIKVPLDSTKETDLTLNSAPNGLSGYKITLSLLPPMPTPTTIPILTPTPTPTPTSVYYGGVAEVTSVYFPSWAIMNSNSALPSNSVWIKAVDLNNEVESGAKNVILASLAVRGDRLGSCNIFITVTRLDDDSGNPIEAITIPAQVEVVSGVIPFPGCDNHPPTDPDNDGLYEDINGNGRKDFDDVVCFFENAGWVEENQPVECFDFNQNGRIDFDDVVKLYEEI